MASPALMSAIAGAARRNRGAGDPYWSNVVSLLHCQGANGSTNIVDATGRHVWTASGSAVLSTAQAKFGTSSLSFLAANDAEIYTSAYGTTDFQLGTADCTIEAWVYPTQYSGSNNDNIRLLTLNATNFYTMEINGGSAHGAGVLDIYLATPNYGPSFGTVPTGGWHHVAFCVHNGTMFAWVDGNGAGSASMNGYALSTSPQLSTDTASWIGPPCSYGYMQEMRVTKGVARYTSAFTPPTAPFPNY
jgi:hypothetical protein